MELWSLMHFLMPHIFQSHKEFKEWFANPVNNMIEGEQDINEDLINRLHGVLRPFLLRRLKKDVEKQLPRKFEHIIPCKLSKRQRFLYEEFMSRSVTKNTLSSGNFLGIINILMQLRKVCNHPDLFEVRPIISPFDQETIIFYTSSLVVRALEYNLFKQVNLSFLNLLITSYEYLDSNQTIRTSILKPKESLIMEISSKPINKTQIISPILSLLEYKSISEERILQFQYERLQHSIYINDYRCSRKPIYGKNLISLLTIKDPINHVHIISKDPKQYWNFSDILKSLICLPVDRSEKLKPIIQNFVCIISRVRAQPIQIHCSHPNPSTLIERELFDKLLISQLSSLSDIFRLSFVRQQLYFPDKRLIQYDCGKLQKLSILLQKLKNEGHRALIFTQMTRMLDILEIFLNIYGYTYLRLDGSTKVERRQLLMERFNTDKRIFLFILSTRSGGIGVNLTGADTVIFYDSDWNPAMDAQVKKISFYFITKLFRLRIDVIV